MLPPSVARANEISYGWVASVMSAGLDSWEAGQGFHGEAVIRVLRAKVAKFPSLTPAGEQSYPVF